MVLEIFHCKVLLYARDAMQDSIVLMGKILTTALLELTRHKVQICAYLAKVVTIVLHQT